MAIDDGSVIEYEPNAWVEVDSAALTANAAALRAYVAARTPASQVIAVVKADGYGHGGARAAKAFQNAGISRFAVTSIDEAIALAAGGIDPRQSPVLVFAPVVTPAQAQMAARMSLEPTVCDAHHIRLLITAANEAQVTIGVHLKVDTGMGRLGETPNHAAALAATIQATDRLKLAGVYTHFPNAGAKDVVHTRSALSAFTHWCDTLNADGIETGIRHAANSAAALRLPESHLDAVRLGTVLYGQYPSSAVPKVSGLTDKTWQAKARVVFVHDLLAGSKVGYGSEVTLRKPARVAVIAIGYADGFTLAPASVYSGKRGVEALIAGAIGRSRPRVYLHGSPAMVLGRVAMQMIVVDVTHLGDKVVEGDIADVPMRRLAASARLPRVDAH